MLSGDHIAQDLGTSTSHHPDDSRTVREQHGFATPHSRGRGTNQPPSFGGPRFRGLVPRDEGGLVLACRRHLTHLLQVQVSIFRGLAIHSTNILPLPSARALAVLAPSRLRRAFPDDTCYGTC